MTKKNTDSRSEATFETFDLSKLKSQAPVERYPVTIWLPKDYQAKYLRIQKLSRHEFGRHIQRGIMKLIDNTEV